MKKLLFALVAVLCLTACHKNILSSIDDLKMQYQNLDSRVTRLENLCKEMNTNITALQTIVDVLQSNDYITGITEIKKSGDIIGYTITFGKHSPITIYNGEDGKDGKDGADGSSFAPTIGVQKDTDGVYYWTLNGSWLLDDQGNKLRVTGEKGEKGDTGAAGQNGQNGTNGTDGVNGANGQNGQNGITPQLKIEEGFWFVSYNGGTSWTMVGRATGEQGEKGDKGDKGDTGDTGATGPAGQNGQDGVKGDTGDSMFSSVTYDANYVYFTLADGTQLKIARGNNSSTTGTHEDTDIIEFKDLAVRRSLLLNSNIDIDGDGEISYGEARNVTRLIVHDENILSFNEFKLFENVDTFSFSGCSKLFEIELPRHITAIPGAAFRGCSSLRQIIFPEGLLSIGDQAFAYCAITKLILPEGLLRIENYAFMNANIKELVIPNSVIYIGEGCLQGATITTRLEIPENVSSGAMSWFGTGSTAKGSVQEIVWNCMNYTESLVEDDYRYGLTKTYSPGYSGTLYKSISVWGISFGNKVKNIPDYLCYNAGISKEVKIPSSVTSIGNSAFYNCTDLPKVEIGSGVKNIGRSAFSNCSSLTNVTFGDSVQNIGMNAFAKCTELTTITLGNEILSIGDYAFNSNSKLYMVYCNRTTPPSLGYAVFDYCNAGLIICVPTASVMMYKAAWSEYADKIVGYDF